MRDIPVYSQVQTEISQSHDTRRQLYIDLEKALGNIPVISFCTSFRYPVMLEDTDVEVIEGLLQKTDTSRGLTLLINSPGGLGLAAERLINICRNYSGTGEFYALVPGRAKSAATMVCMGASKIYMSKTSELGPIDPQITIQESRMPVALFNVVQSYKDLFRRAVGEKKGNLAPYLQQLAHYDEREIKQYESALELAEDVAVRALKSGMLRKLTSDKIREKIKVFLTPEETKSHGRSIFFDEAKKCGLNVDLMDIKSKLWKLSYELCVRLHYYTTSNVSKSIENKEFAFAASSGPPGMINDSD